MAMAYCNGLMGSATKETSKKTKGMAKVYFTGKMEGYTMGDGKMVNSMVEVC